MEINTTLDLTSAEIEEITRIVNKEAQDKGETVLSVDVSQDGEELIIKPYYRRKIQRIRRITGYLSNEKNFNDAKIAEARDRYCHM
ncbi:anaerobic ribonucleoside-triphosphate reductase [Bacillota bacterium LX-D]|nr:anaerobic ribonucleoside-triphosphate reductase [Bacillota bacterium LX-D]